MPEIEKPPDYAGGYLFFGGEGSYKYKFEDVENYVGVEDLFEGDRVLVDNAFDEYVRVINNIYNQ